MSIASRIRDFFRPRPVVVPEVTTEATGSSSKKGVIAPVKCSGYSIDVTQRDQFVYPETFDMLEIERAYDTDSYIRQAVDKYVDSIFKAGYDIVGKNADAVTYIKSRLQVMSMATSIPTSQLFVDIADDLIMYHNVFIIKARTPNYPFPAGITANPIDTLNPVTGYFVLPPSTISIKRDDKGSVKQYQQQATGSSPKTIRVDDMIHVYADKPRGRAYGVPFLWQVLDDVRLLREVEELISRLIYKDIFPMLHYKIGGIDPSQDPEPDEIDDAALKLEQLTIDGAIVTSSRHTLEVLGSEGKALNAYNYLKHFEERVFTGLGVSATTMGRGSTSNKSTADNLTAQLHDKVKAYQTIISSFINDFMFRELLLEGGYDFLSDPNNMVTFQFKEIDIDNKMKIENQAIQKFTNNAISHEELRNELGQDPVTDMSTFYFNMITIATAKAQADFAAQAQAAKASVDNKAQPENQYVKKLSSMESLVEEVKHPLVEYMQEAESSYVYALKDVWNATKNDVIALIKQYYMSQDKKLKDFNDKDVEMIIKVSSDIMRDKYEKVVTPLINKSILDVMTQSGKGQPKTSVASVIPSLRIQHQTEIEKLLTQDLLSLLSKKIRASTLETTISNVVGVFEAYEYRLRFIARTDLYRAYNYAFAKSAMSLRHKKAYVLITNKECDKCSGRSSVTLNTELQDIPPFHTNCMCLLTLNNGRKEDNDAQN